MKRYYAIMKSCNEKTGDSYYSFSRLSAAQHFAKKKMISLKNWLKIYTVID